MATFKPAPSSESTITLPLHGGDGVIREYVIKSPSARVGLAVHELMRGAQIAAENQAAIDAGMEPRRKKAPKSPYLESILLDDDDRTLDERVMGDALDQMIRDDCSADAINLAVKTATYWIAYGEEIAVEFWENGGSLPKERNRAQRRKKRKK